MVTHAPNPTRPSLSVVVPTYNEEDRIETCLDSVFAACGRAATEVIVVDSNSTDRTVELARQYPVSIYRIADDDLTTPGAGRFVGQQAASGDQILFVDGDMRISGEWFDRARQVVSQRDDVAGVDGYLNSTNSTTVESVEALRGVVLYDGDVLERVGGFDPFLRALEDIELGFRITGEGYVIQRLPLVAAAHPYASGPAELRRRWRNGYFFGVGQVVRKHLRAPRMVGKLVSRKLYMVLFCCWVTLGATTLAVQPQLVVAWVVFSVVLFTSHAAWEGFHDAAHRFSKYALEMVGFLRGVIMPVREHGEFPVEAVELVATPEAVEA
jgi:glycosyltransferase involved in cell wall biosynthesis